MQGWPDNADTLEVRTAKECAVSAAFLQYLASTGLFTGWKEEQAEFKILMKKDPIAVWTAFESIPEVAELVKFAVILLKIVVNQAGYNEDETKRGQLLVASRESWRTEMAKCIGEARAAELAEEDQDKDDITLVGNDHALKRKQTTLAVLFGGQKERPSRLSPAEVDAELVLMEALAEAEEDEQLDDGEVEINLDDEFVG
ncbi:hypothetical protein PILCRDRAFT_521 [Piloderma croceum F 1598]|uniref:Uncharacterized protein n=1 Tax=Piloderma croceum (strain F 1598) TaxID=765440 RepID=A0A0C3BXM2_PILCF|nr:hypothetical protein PILCRDRAFT_521 [Piloderma croceum F 1598]